MRRGILILAALAGWLAGAARAQVSGTVDLGAGTYRPDRAIPGGVATVAPTLRYRAGPVDLDAAGVYSDAPAGRWNFQGATAATLGSPVWGIAHGEITAEADWTSHDRARGTTAIGATARLSAAPSATTRLWLGAGRGTAEALGQRRGVRRAEFGTSTSLAGVQLGLRLLSTSFTLVNDPGGSGPGLPDTLETHPADTLLRQRSGLTDAVLSGRWRMGTLDLDASVGRRFSRSTPELTIWGVSASRELTPSLDLVAAAGRAGSDPVTSVPGSRYVVLGLRLKLGGSPGPLFLPPPAPRERAAFRVGPLASWGREVVVRVPGAAGVELAADFTDWRPVALERWGGDAWRAVFSIPGGLHRVAIRVDGGAWRAPPGARPVPTEFGGEVAEIAVE